MNDFRTGRARSLAAFAFGAALAFVRQEAAAQDGEEVILDPELAGSAPAPSPASPPPASEPTEDFGWGPVQEEGRAEPPPPPPSAEAAAHSYEDEPDPLANTGLARLELLGQVAADMHQEGSLEDAYETRLRFGGEVELRRSRNLRLMLGSRLDFFWAVPGQNDPVLRDHDPPERALDEDRFEVDVFATAAYVDTTLGDGFHLRLGQQAISLGRMDMYSPTDILAAYDLRPQPRLDLAANKLAQPAVRVDWDLNSWATLQFVYLPWFMPHLSRPNRDQYVAQVVGGGGTGQLPGSLSNLVDPSWQTKMSESGLRFVGPAPDFKTPQAQLRSNFRGDAMEFGLSAGTALEKLPQIYYTPTVNDLAIDPNNDALLQRVGGPLSAGAPLVDIAYQRYYLLGVDGSFDISPVSIGFEFAFSPSRHLYAATNDGRHLPIPNTTQQILDPVEDGDGNWKGNVTNTKIRKGVPMVQGALHVEWLKGETFAAVAEAFWMNALALPYDKSRDWWGFIPGTGTFAGGMLALSYAVLEGTVRFDVTTVTMVGPSLILVPHIEVKAKEGLYLDAGAQNLRGPEPGHQRHAEHEHRRPLERLRPGVPRLPLAALRARELSLSRTQCGA
ncbi:MAG: hypothetical protein QM778_27125 [Myxococcales bacterium]